MKPDTTQPREQATTIAQHLQNAHDFIENTEAFGRAAASGVLECGAVRRDIDASKAALARASSVAAPEAPIYQARHEHSSAWQDIAPDFYKLVDPKFRRTVYASTGAAPEAPASEQQTLQSDMRADYYYLQGLRAGWNLSQQRDVAGFNAALVSRQNSLDEAKAELHTTPPATASASGEPPLKVFGYIKGIIDADFEAAGVEGRAPAPSRDATPIKTWREELGAGWESFGIVEKIAARDVEIFKLRAALTQQSAAPSRDAILETAVQAVSERAGDSDKVSVVSALEAIRACKTNRHALPESCSAQQSAAQAPSQEAAKAVQVFTCIGKGGEYEVIGYSNGAGPKRGESIVVYRRAGEDEILYHRSTDDFRARMQWQGTRAAQASHAGADTERLDFIAEEECRIEVMAGPRYRLHWPDQGEWQREWFKSPREAIDNQRAAMSAATEQKEKP